MTRLEIHSDINKRKLTNFISPNANQIQLKKISDRQYSFSIYDAFSGYSVNFPKKFEIENMKVINCFTCPAVDPTPPAAPLTTTV